MVQQKIATDVSVSYDGFSVGPGSMDVSAHPAKGVTLPQLEAAIDKELADASNIVVTEDELDATTMVSVVSVGGAVTATS